MPEKTNPKSNLPETLTWKSPSHLAHKRSALWYIFFGLGSLGLLAFALYDRHIITIITFVLIILMIFLIISQPQREIVSKITKNGIHIGDTEYPYKIIKRFWIVYNPPQVKTLNFETTTYINNRITVQLGSQDPLLVKRVLSQYLLEDLDQQESTADILARKLKI
ncbi:MAG TPA: hypothetical protein VL306_00920 [Methylomirabilota bacterium]|jgi:hypothetical protein|nr:hypothetical protein [Methylomirabilota bacterium]